MWFQQLFSAYKEAQIVDDGDTVSFLTAFNLGGIFPDQIMKISRIYHLTLQDSDDSTS